MRNILLLSFSGLLIFSGCHSQTENKPENRKPFVAGSFYQADPDLLRGDLENLFDEAKTNVSDGLVQAIIVPHAGYLYSGVVAASGYNQLDKTRGYKHIFILASSHRASYNGASIYNIGHYETPLGTAHVDIELAKKLTDQHDIFTFNRQADAQEHSIEVQLPFLQYRFGNDFIFIPVLLGTHDVSDC